MNQYTRFNEIHSNELESNGSASSVNPMEVALRSNNWERHNRRNPCPVCGETKHCRTNKDNGLVHCRGDNPSSDYRFLKEDKWGFGIFKHKDDIEREKEENKEQWLEEKRREREQRDRQRKEQLKQQLTVEERDKAIRRVLSQLNLNATDRERLKARGLTDDQINEAQYRSVKKWQELDGVTVALAGINRRGNLNNPWDGILIPIPNEDGLWVGMRLHDPNNKETGNAKYIWLSSPKSEKFPCFRNGENPIAIYYPSEYQHYDRIGLCEGLEWKPKIAAERLGYPVIGFSGSHFDTSPKTLKATLSRLQEKIGNDNPELTLIPDGGITINPNVFGGYEKTAKLLNGWGYTNTSILDWGQLNEKSNNDIDEISSEVLGSAIAISASEFFKSPDPDLGEEEWTEPDQEAYTQHERELEEEEEVAEAEKEREREQWRENYPIAAKNSYNKLKRYTPDTRINTPLIQKDDIKGLMDENQGTALKGAMGTGKTQLIAELVSIFGDEKWRSIGYRNNLLIQSSKDWGMIHLPTAEANGLSTREIIKAENSKTSSCIDSVTTRYNPEDFDGCNLVLDEANALVTHLLTARTEVSKRLEETCELFAEALQRSKRIFIMDALLTDDAIAYLQKLAPNKTIRKIQNDYKNPTEITHFVGTEEEVEGEVIVRKNKRNPLVEMMLSAERPVICSDSQLFCAAMEHILQKEGKQGVRIDGETSGEEQAKAFLENPDAFIKAMKPDYLIYSPSMESGNSIKIRDYFDEQYSFFFGSINTDSQHQMMFRPRDRAIKRFVWCKEFDSNSDKLRSPFPRTNLRNHKAMLMLDIQNCFARGEDVTEQLKALTEMNKECPHDLMWSCLESIYSYEKSNLRQCLIESLEHSGHQITEIALRDLSGDKIESEAKDETKDRYADDIFNAEDIDASEIEERKKRGKWKDQCAVSKKVLKLQLPDIETTPHWNPDTIRLLKYDERDRVRKLERYWMLNNLDGAKQLQRDRWEKVSNGVIHKYHLRSDYSKVLALIEAGIEQFMNPDKEWKADDPEVQEFIKNCQKHDFKLAFGKAPSKKSHPMRWIGSCLEFFGCEWRDRQRRINGDQIRFYRVVLTLKTDMRNPTFYECITKRLNKNLENLNSEKTPETHITTGVDAVTEGVTVFKQYKHFCDTSDHTEYPSQQDATQPMENSNSDRAPGPPRPPKKGDRVLLKTVLPRKDWVEATVLAVKDNHIEVDAVTPKGKRITRWLADSIAYPDSAA